MAPPPAALSALAAPSAALSASAAASVSSARAAPPARDRGQGLVEYGLILGLAALVTVIALVFFGGALAAGLSLLGQAIDSSN